MNGENVENMTTIGCSKDGYYTLIYYHWKRRQIQMVKYIEGKVAIEIKAYEENSGKIIKNEK